MKKTIFTLDIDYSKKITDITYPLIKQYAHKIGANFHIINKRTFKDLPVTYEKLQIYELGKDNDWNIYIDSDAMIHPDTPDFTSFLPSDTVMHAGVDFAPIRWKYDEVLLRDGRNIGSCNWFTIAPHSCLNLWSPLDVSLKYAVYHIFPTHDELCVGITPEHLLDDYALSRNIARFGLKFLPYEKLKETFGIPGDYFYHEYLMTMEEKIVKLTEIKDFWKLSEKERNEKIAKEKSGK